MRTSRVCFQRLCRAFTLIETLVVVLILSILMLVALPLYLIAVVASRSNESGTGSFGRALLALRSVCKGMI